MIQKTIQELLENEYLVVPEIQREYVWGKLKDVTEQFIVSLQNKSTNVGFLYSYSFHNQKYIIDGQQRFTTLVLMLYYAAQTQNREDDFHSLLKVDSPNLSFTYRVRSNTEQFMKDLFGSGLYKGEEIRKSKWYHDFYRSDLSISSMIDFLDSLSKSHFDLPYEEILKISFWYYPVEETSLGEDLYITMNSRGRILDNAEKLKPLLFKKAKIGKEKDENWGKIWDDWEDFFYQRLENPDIENINNINVAMENFIRIVWELETCNEHNSLKPSEAILDLNLFMIQRYFDALRRIEDSLFSSEIDRLFGEKAKKGDSNKNDANFIILKSLLSGCVKFANQENTIRNIELKRIYETSYNKLHRRNYVKHIPILKFLKSYRDGSEYNYYKAILVEHNDSDCYFDEADKKMIRIMCESTQNNSCKISELEKFFWKTCNRSVSNHYIWEGDLTILIKWASIDGYFCFDEFKKYSIFFDSLFTDYSRHEIDLLRRAWIVGMPEYVPVKVGSYYTFGWEWSDWRTFVTQNPSDFKSFMDSIQRLMESGFTQEEALSIYINNGKEKDYMEFAKDNFLMDFTKRSKTCDIYFEYNKKEWWICTSSDGKRRHKSFLSVHHAYILRAFGGNYENYNKDKMKPLNIGDWGVWYWSTYKENCIAVESQRLNLVIDIVYDASNKRCDLVLKSRKDEDINKYSSGYRKRDEGNGYYCEYSFDDFCPQNIVDKVLEKINEIEYIKEL